MTARKKTPEDEAPASKTFEVGDVVTLNSGGKRMTVIQVESESFKRSPFVTVAYADDTPAGEKIERTRFHRNCLMRPDKDDLPF